MISMSVRRRERALSIFPISCEASYKALMATLLENKHQAFKVRLFIWFALLCSAGALYWGWDLFHTYGLSPGDGGVLRPYGERLALGLLMASLGLALAGCIMVYACHYVVHMARNGGQVVIDTHTPLGLGTQRHEFDAAQIGKSNYHDGSMIARVSVNAPWLTLHASGRRFPFILDAQSETLRRSDIESLSRGTPRRRKK